MSEWQPIETAPKGEPVLLYCPEDYPAVVACIYWAGFDQGWAFADDTLANVAPDGPEYPTHWMPIPAPPQKPDAFLAEASEKGWP